MRVPRIVGVGAAALALLTGCGGGDDALHDRIDAALTAAQQAGIYRPDMSADDRRELVETVEQTCHGDRTARASSAMILGTGGDVAEGHRMMLAAACPDVLADLD